MPQYQSLFDANLGNQPDITSGAWSTTITQGTGSASWRPLQAAVQTIDIMYPVGTGPSTDASSANVFLLPNGYLREAPQSPGGGPTWGGGPSADFYNDWVIESDFLLTSQSYPIVFRFVADIVDVPSMDPMFCEGVSARLAEGVCETLTQSTGKLQAIASVYKQFMGEARAVNGIETGYQDPPEDDFISVRY